MWACGYYIKTPRPYQDPLRYRVVVVANVACAALNIFAHIADQIYFAKTDLNRKFSAKAIKIKKLKFILRVSIKSFERGNGSKSKLATSWGPWFQMF